MKTQDLHALRDDAEHLVAGLPGRFEGLTAEQARQMAAMHERIASAHESAAAELEGVLQEQVGISEELAHRCWLVEEATALLNKWELAAGAPWAEPYKPQVLQDGDGNHFFFVPAEGV